MQTAISIIIGIMIGGAVGVTVMCLAQVTQCADCPYRSNGVNRDGK
jgi:hypothetical protein